VAFVDILLMEILDINKEDITHLAIIAQPQNKATLSEATEQSSHDGK